MPVYDCAFIPDSFHKLELVVIHPCGDEIRRRFQLHIPERKDRPEQPEGEHPFLKCLFNVCVVSQLLDGTRYLSCVVFGCLSSLTDCQSPSQSKIIVHCLLKHNKTLVISGSRINKYSLCYKVFPRCLYKQIQFVCASCIVFPKSAVTLLHGENSCIVLTDRSLLISICSPE